MNRAIRPLTLAVVGVTAALVAAAPAASADPGYYVFGTEIGIYPRVEPSMDSAKTGVALADGTPLNIACQTTGVPFGGNAVFNRLVDGTYLPDYFTYTGVDGFDPRLPRCEDTPAPAPTPTEPAKSAPTSSWVPFCGSSKYVEKIEVVQWEGDNFQIVLTPTAKARHDAAWNPDLRGPIVEQWHAIQNCVAGLEGEVADTIWDQLECHQLFSWIKMDREDSEWATGDTFELESWLPKLNRDITRIPQYFTTQCANTLEKDPAGPFSSPIRPDLGITDLQGAYAAIA